MAESWYKVYCPNCKAKNWFCNGDETDLTAVDVEAVECHKCGYIWSTEEMAGGKDDTPQNVRKEEWYYVYGIEHPE